MNEAREEKRITKGRNKRKYKICSKYSENNAVKFLMREGFADSKKAAKSIYASLQLRG